MNNKSNRTLSQEEIQNLISACDNQLKPIVILALHSGMRKGEILGLKWDDVDFDHGLIHVLSMKGRHTIPLSKTTRHLLQGLTRNPDIPFVFYNPRTGKPYHDVRKSFHSACRKAKIDNVRFHDTRRTFLNNLFLAGDCSSRGFEIFGVRVHSPFVSICGLSADYKTKIMAALDKLINGKATS